MEFDVVIIGGGPAGCTAALYCARFGRSVAVFEAAVLGGQMAEAAKIENYPAIDCADGVSLAQTMRRQIEGYGVKIFAQQVTEVELDGARKRICTSAGVYFARAVILATGAKAKRLGLENETALIGRGVSYCAACDGAIFRGKTVAVVGGGASAVSEALQLSQLCRQVHLFHRRAELRASEVDQAAVKRQQNLIFHPSCVVCELLADEKLRGIRVEDLRTGSVYSQTLDGLFIAIGRAPENTLFQALLATDEQGFLHTDAAMQTALSGVFAAGDLRAKTVRQITTAVSDGTVAAFSAEEYLKGSS